MTQPMAGPCDSPKLVTVKSVPNVLPLIVRRIMHVHYANTFGGPLTACYYERNSSESGLMTQLTPALQALDWLLRAAQQRQRLDHHR